MNDAAAALATQVASVLSATLKDRYFLCGSGVGLAGTWWVVEKT
jgi:uncharacterized membrane protein